MLEVLKQWRCYLEGVPKEKFILVTDHHPLTYLQTQQCLSRRQARWSEYLQRFVFKWHYRPGRSNVADAISRMPHLDCTQVAAVSTRAQDWGTQTAGPGAMVRAPDHLSGLSDRVVQGYAKDGWFQQQQNRDKLMSAQDLLWHEGCLVIPDYDGLRKELMYLHHDTPYAGHVGANKSTVSLQRQYWWPGMRADIVNYVQTCTMCQRSKPEQQRPAGLLQPLPVPEKFWQSVSMELITQLPQTPRGSTAIVVFVDRLSKMAHFAACKGTMDSEGLARLLVDNVFRLHGAPREVISDRDPRLTSTFDREFYQLLGTGQHMSTTFYHQTDGQTERVNRVLEEMLRSYISPSLDDWDLHLSLCEFACKAPYHDTVKASPFELMYGSNPRIPATF